MRDQLTPAMVFQGLPMVFNAEAARGLRALYRFDITGDGGGTWTVNVSDGACEILDGAPATEPDWRLELSADTWLAMTTGEYIGQEAFMLGRVTVEGDAIAGLRFDELFALPRL